MKKESKSVTWSRIERYRDFYDVPRMFLINFQGRFLFFDCSFDNDTEEYAKSYKVFIFPRIIDEELSGNWDNLYKRAISCLGEVSVDQLEFDPTHRRLVNIDADWFRKLILNN